MVHIKNEYYSVVKQTIESISVEKIVRDREGGWLQRMSVFQTQLDWCTYEFTETVAAGIESEASKPR